MSMTADITERVVSTAKKIESIDDPDDDYLDPLDVEVTASLDGTVREIVLILTVGGPHIEVNVSRGTVYGAWEGNSHRTHVTNDDILDVLHFRYEELFNCR